MISTQKTHFKSLSTYTYIIFVQLKTVQVYSSSYYYYYYFDPNASLIVEYMIPRDLTGNKPSMNIIASRENPFLF